MDAAVTCACGRPATRTIAAVDHCDTCTETILTPLRKKIARSDGVGFGEPTGKMRPDWQPGYAELTCNTCAATWIGPAYERCAWCHTALEHMRAWQAEIVLRPELPDHDDARYQDAAGAWAERLGRAVTAELVTPSQAAAAIAREARRRVDVA